MGFAINTNVSALNSYRNLSNTQNDISKSLEKLSTGLRINRAADDAAGLSISEGLRAQVNGLNVAARNAQDGISMIQTAEGALTEVHSILQRMRDLAVQGSNDSNNGEARQAIQDEATQLGEELTRIASSTNFSGIKLLQGTDMNFQVGADGSADNAVSVSLADVMTSVGNLAVGDALAADGTTVAGTGDGTSFNVATHGDAQTTIVNIDAAITAISGDRSSLGASQNRLESALKHINISAENLSASESRIRDVDMAKEMASFTKSQIMSQAGTAMLAQANQINQGVLQLLG